MFRFRVLAIPALLFAAACAAAPSTPSGGPDDPGSPGDPSTPGTPSNPGTPGNPADPGTGRILTTNELKATGLGVAIMSSDASGAPRLIRSVVPRQGAAGLAPAAVARDHVAALTSLWVPQGPAASLVEKGTVPLRNGATMVHLSQEVAGVPVDRGELHVLMHTDGSLAAVSGTLLPGSSKPAFAGTALTAVGHALTKQYGAAKAQMAVTDRGATGGWHALDVASSGALQVSTARARQVMAQVGGQLTEAWEVEVEGDAVADPKADSSIPTYSYHSYLVADATGTILRDTDLVAHDAFVYRAYGETTGNRRPLDGPLEDFSPHPTGLPDGSAPALRPSANLIVMQGFNATSDPWLANNATTTSGNNAEAFSDLDASRTFTPGDSRPVVKSGRVLNYNYDHTLEPLANTDQLAAGAVNAFYMVNWMHDWWYDSGFTEAAGNAQLDNLGRGGIAGDPLLVTSQAGANTGLRNNADMSTPADGARPRMRMFLWTAGTITSLTGPTGTPRSESFTNGPRTFDLTAQIVAATDATAPFDDACQPVTSNVAGKIAFVSFSGTCGSAATVNDVKAAGAIGVIISDPASDDPRAFAGSAAANIPGLAIGKTDGAALAAAIAAGPVTIEITSGVSGPERDGDLDNTVVGHEWGHYLHHRLAICGTQQCGGMSEGWGDFNALMMMLRDGDNRDGVYGEAAYAVDNGTPNSAYFGIRRFPYSRDRTKNNLSFRHIGDENPLPTDTPGSTGGVNSEVHNTGEIWATMMWEALNVLADQHGVTVARRRMSDYVVAGLQLTPPEATFTEARDAILAAASAQDTDDMILMAAAFAGRGLGSCAVSPDVNSPNNFGAVESGTLAGKFAVGGASLVDDGVSCDHDGYLDPGESGTLHVTVANNGILAAENVVITASTTSAGVRIGAPIKMALLQPFSSSALSIPVTLLPTAPRNTVISIKIHVAGDDTCDKNGIDGTLTLRTGVDDVPNASNIDHADTKVSAWTPTGDGAAALWGRALDGSFNQSFFGVDPSFPADTQFESPVLNVSTTQPFVLKYSHAYSLEASGGSFFDGGVVEISLNGGATWNDVSSFGVNPGYTGVLINTTGNPLGGRNSYSGVSAGFPAKVPVTLNFGTIFSGLQVKVRFRVASDAAVSQVGWIIDDVEADGITNTPFPQLVSEPSTCTARARSSEDSGVIATHSAPAVSLAAFDSAVCVLQDAQ